MCLDVHQLPNLYATPNCIIKIQLTEGAPQCLWQIRIPIVLVCVIWTALDNFGETKLPKLLFFILGGQIIHLIYYLVHGNNREINWNMFLVTWYIWMHFSASKTCFSLAEYDVYHMIVLSIFTARLVQPWSCLTCYLSNINQPLLALSRQVLLNDRWCHWF